jgi:hypothetical protein
VNIQKKRRMLYKLEFPSLLLGALRTGLFTLVLGGSPVAWSYTLTCEVQGSFPDLEKMIVQPATVTIDISSIGNHLYIKMDGPKLYNMFVNTLISPEFEGTDLTSDTSIWVKRRNVQTKEEAEIKIRRQPVFVQALKDVKRYGKDMKFVVSGPCKLPLN